MTRGIATAGFAGFVGLACSSSFADEWRRIFAGVSEPHGFGLVELDDGLGERVVVPVADGVLPILIALRLRLP